MLGDALRDVCGPLGDLNQKLSGPEGKKWLRELKVFLRKERSWAFRDFPVWKTVILGTRDGPTEVRRAFREHGIKFGGEGNKFLTRVSNLVKDWGVVREVDLVRLPAIVPEFNRLRIPEVYDQVQKWGLELCSYQLAPCLRYQYLDQPTNEVLFIGMPLVEMVDSKHTDDSKLFTFQLERNESGIWISEESHCRATTYLSEWCKAWWVFVKPRRE